MPASAPPALPLVDLVLRGGRIRTFADPGQGPAEVPAIALAGGRVVAIGDDTEIAPYAALAARVVDLDGRVALPGLNDSHIHAVRGGASWTRTMHWEDVRSVAEALDRVRGEALRRGPGAWVSAIGGWHSRQFAEGRPPTREELDAAAPENPVYVQELYDRGILNTAGLRAAGLPETTGDLHGLASFAGPIALALAGGDDGDATEGLRAMSAALARCGLTGVIDGGGLLMTPRSYDPVYDLWRRGGLDVRLRLYVSAWDRGGEVANIDRLTEVVPPDAGDGMLRVSGVGEIPHLGCHDMEGFDAFEIPDAAHREFVDIVRLCVARGWRMSVHAVREATLGRILDAWEEVERETGGVSGAGFSIVHADEASRANLERIAALGAGVLVQSRLLLKATDYIGLWGAEQTAAAPPIGDIRALGIPMAAGTDATRANWYSPWASIWWLVTGGTLDGQGVRDRRHRLTREEALAAYTRDAAWFTGEQASRGRLLPGYDADVCVPTLDPFTCAEEDLRDIRSDLTVLGGRVTADTGVLTGALERPGASAGKDIR